MTRIARVGVPVMAGPQDRAAGGNRLRAGHADRERVIEALKDAFVHGRLTRCELDSRAGEALAARTYADLAALTADIPAVGIPARPAPAGPVRPPAPVERSAPVRRPLARAVAGSGVCLVIAFGAVLVGGILDADSVGPGPQGSWIPVCLFVAVAAVITAIGILLNGVGTAVAQRWSRRQPPLLKPGARP